jgi:hypothetical protein
MSHSLPVSLSMKRAGDEPGRASRSSVRPSIRRIAALVPVFQPWIEPLRDLGVAAVSSPRYCAADCVSFERVGIPTPGFNEDPLDYETRTRHTNMDTYEHLIPQDLRQAAIVAATMLYNTAMREEMLPRTGLLH